MREIGTDVRERGGEGERGGRGREGKGKRGGRERGGRERGGRKGKIIYSTFIIVTYGVYIIQSTKSDT